MVLIRFCVVLIAMQLGASLKAYAQDNDNTVAGSVTVPENDSPRVVVDAEALLDFLIEELSRDQNRPPLKGDVPKTPVPETTLPPLTPGRSAVPAASAPPPAGGDSLSSSSFPPVDYDVLTPIDVLPAAEDLPALPAGRFLVRLDAGALGLDDAALDGIGAAEFVDLLAPAVQIEPWQVRHIYRAVYFGAALDLTKAQSGQLMANISTFPAAQVGVDTPVAPAQTTGVSWALDRIDQESLPLDGEYGAPVSDPMARIYVLDTGIKADHEQLVGRVSQAMRFTASASTFQAHDSNASGAAPGLCARHGTAMASLMAGETTGVAQDLTLIDVTVLPCPPWPGAASDVIAGLDWVLGQERNSAQPGNAVVNMSLSGPHSPELNDAASAVARSGIPVVAAAGNITSVSEGNDSCTRSPAAAEGVISVAASDRYDHIAPFSILGACVDLIAPGEDVLTASSSGTNSYARTSGTSEAAALVSGLIAAQGVDNTAQVTLAEAERHWTDPLTQNAGRVTPPDLLLVPEGGAEPGPAAPLSLVRAPRQASPPPDAPQQARAAVVPQQVRVAEPPLHVRAPVAPFDCKVSTMTSPLNLRAGPSEAASIITTLQDGAGLWLIDTDKGWIKVRSPNGDLGWVARRYTVAAVRSDQRASGCGPMKMTD